ncbi:alpha/beta family hydrolase [Mucilaginibacter auburnensis]|uniref:KANL3/Tex30 alpha/beta hydrolase-like domain-containing protein n=1 Tax=Mucilaginibacter auburnensis TaxID=1457233 RepID=A0A2H9VR71_9SPHI|nr:alpha/beta family hydrolase [Mucilaginibacter auburnensis]PJJ83327.1 hypothetical protein CLV57_0307 [Mucilaginibacter auburnensis]
MNGKTALIIIERSNAREDYELILKITSELTGLFDHIFSLNVGLPNHEVLLFDNLSRRSKLFFLLRRPLAWPSYIKGIGKSEFDKRCIQLIRQVKLLQKKGFKIILLGRSAGARIATMLADQLCIEKVICMGYPFKNPHQPDEPIRYMHLKELQTPTLILQGINDVYGGLGVHHNYSLSNTIKLDYVNTNHNFNLNQKEMEKVVLHIVSFVADKIDLKKEASVFV